MEKKSLRLLFYCVYVGLVLGITTSVLFAVRGRCHYIDSEGDIVFVACDCPCEIKDRHPSDPLFCTRCRHYVKPQEQEDLVNPDKKVESESSEE